MAVGETLVTVVGNVCGELTRRVVGEGVEVVSFWMRSNERRFDKDEGQWRDWRHFSVRVTCWRKLAGAVHRSLSNGDPVIATGRLHISEYEQAGQPRSVPELDAVAVGPNLSWCTAVVERRRKAAGGGDLSGWSEPLRQGVASTTAGSPVTVPVA